MSALRRVAWVGGGLVVAAAASLVLLESSLDAMDVLRVGELEDFRELHRRSGPAALSADGRPVLWRLEATAPWTAGEAGFAVEANRDGRRGAAVGVPKPAGVFRIVAFGDGLVFGWGVDSELTVVHQLEVALRERAPDGVAIEVVNAGHPFHTLAELPASLAALRALEPDLLLVFDRARAGGLPPDLRRIRDREEPEPAWWGRLFPTLHDVAARGSGESDAGDDEAVLPAERLTALAAAARRDGLPVVLVEVGARTLPDQGVPVLRIALGSAAAGPTVAPRTGFPTVRGHRELATGLAATLVGLVPARGD